MAEIRINVRTEGGEQSLRNINDLKTAIKELETQSENLDLGSDAFENSKKQIEELKQKYQELTKSQQQLENERNEAANQSVEEQAARAERVGNNVQKFAAGLTDAFAGAFIAFGATGAEAEELNKTLQQGVGVALGVKGGIEAIVAGVELAGPAFEAFNAIIAANPIAATVIAIAALTAGIYLLVKAVNAEEKESEKLTKQLEEQKKAAIALKAVNDNEIAIMEAKLGLMQAQGKSDAEILKAQNELYAAKRKGLEQDLVQLELQARISQAKLAEELANTTLTESYYELAASIARKTGDDQQAAVLEALLAKSRKDRQKEATDQLVTDLTAVAKLKTDLSVLDIQQQAAVAAIQTKNREEYKKTAEEAKKTQEEAYKAYQERFAKELELLKSRTSVLDEARQQEIADEEEFEAKKAKAKLDGAKLTYLYSKKGVDDEIALLEAQRQEEIRIAREKGEDIALINKKYADAEDKVRQEGNQKIADDNKAKYEKLGNDIRQYASDISSVLNQVLGVFDAVNQLQQEKRDQELKRFQDNTDQQLEYLNNSKQAELSKVGLTEQQKANINNLYAQKEYQLRLEQYNKETEVKKKAFEQDKKLKIAQAIITTATGVISALAGLIGTNPTPIGIALAVATAAAVAAAGAVQIAAIRNTKFEAGTPPPAPTLSVPSPDTGSGNSGPNNNGARQGPQLYDINGDPDTGSGDPTRRTGSNQPIRAYVVSQEVTSSQDMNAVIERRASF